RGAVDKLEELNRELHVDESPASELRIVPSVRFVGNLALHAVAHGPQLARGLLGVERAEQAGLEDLACGPLEERCVTRDRARAEQRLTLPQPRLAPVVRRKRVERDDERTRASAGPQARVDSIEEPFAQCQRQMADEPLRDASEMLVVG